MKRASTILIALIAVLLVYPATMPSAKSPSVGDTPTRHIITPYVGPTGDLGMTGDDDDGDGDGIAGIRGGERPIGTGFVTASPDGSGAKIWWMYLLIQFRVLY